MQVFLGGFSNAVFDCALSHIGRALSHSKGIILCFVIYCLLVDYLFGTLFVTLLVDENLMVCQNVKQNCEKQMNNYLKLPMLLLFCWLLLPANAQKADTLRLSLTRAIEIAIQQSPTVRSARHTFLAQHWNYRYYRANYLPSVTLESSSYVNNVINKITQGDGTSLFLGQSQFGSDLVMNINQNIALTGGTLFLKSSTDYLREVESKTNMFSTVPISIGYTQSLFGHNSFKWDRMIEPLRYTEAKKSYAETLELVKAQACNIFFNLASAQEDVEIACSNFANADTLYRMAQGRYKLGTITENEMLQLEIRRLSEETNMMDCRIAYDEELNSLRSFLALPQGVAVLLLLPDSVPQLSVPLSDAMDYAMLNSPDPMYYERLRREARSNLSQAKAGRGLKADIYLQFGLSQTGNRLGASYSHPMTQKYASISLSLPILDWGRGSGKVRVARSQLELAEIQAEQGMEDFNRNIQKVVSQFNMQCRKVHIARLTKERAEQRHTVAMRLYIMGQSTLLDLNNAITECNAARRSYIYSLSTYWRLFYTLRSITGYDFLNMCEITEQLPL